MTTHRFSKPATVLSMALLMGALACSEEKPSESSGTGGTTASGGTNASGGTSGSGGTSATGGTSSGSGGASATGGVSGSGGVSATGGTTSGTGGTTSGAGGTIGDAGGGDGSAGGDTPAAGGELKLDVKGFTMMGGQWHFPRAATAPGGHHSPAMEWPGAPAEAKSFAVSLVDMYQMAATADGKFHWILWDIPATTKGLAEDLPKVSPLTTPAEVAGAQQLNLVGNGKSYFGPGAGGMRPYRFEVWALDVAKLPVQNMSLGAIFNLLKTHKIKSARFEARGY